MRSTTRLAAALLLIFLAAAARATTDVACAASGDPAAATCRLAGDGDAPHAAPDLYVQDNMLNDTLREALIQAGPRRARMAGGWGVGSR